MSDAAAARTGSVSGRLADGQPVALLADLPDAGPAGLDAARVAGAEGVGMLRTESLYAGGPPAARDAASAYGRVCDAYPGRVTVRVVDPGATSPPLADPALRGVRGLRRHPALLTAQLDAVVGAARARGAEVSVVVAGVTDADDAAWFVEHVRAAGLGAPGVVVDVPAAALTAGTVLRVAGSATVATDELARHTLALPGPASALDVWHPAVLRLAELVGATGSLAGSSIGACGTATRDPLLACVLVGMGIDRISAPPAALGAVRAELSRHRFADCLRYADIALRAPTAADARRRTADAAASG